MVLNSGMRIGELAAIAGVSTRTVRHYHHEGLLPEPARDASGYRRYTIPDLAQLLRIRRLRELGCGVPDVRRILAGQPSQNLREVLQRLDDDLAQQQRSIGLTRERIQQIMKEPHLDYLADAESIEAQAVFSHLKALGAEGPGYQVDMALMGAMPGQHADNWSGAWHQLLADPDNAEALASSYTEFDALIEVEPGDLRVQALADRLWALMPEEFLSDLALTDNSAAGAPVVEALAESMSPAQARVMELIMGRLAGRHRDDDQ